MGNGQSAFGAARAPAAEEAPPLQAPVTITIPSGLESFALFPKLPLELQAKIWAHALERHQVTPRVIKTIYNMATNSYSYNFAIPPLIITCRLSRQIARGLYPSLLTDSTHPVYFNPAVDFLYCTTTYDLPYAMNQHEIEPVISFIKSSTITEKIRFLALDSSYWTRQIYSMLSVPEFASMPELHLFAGIEELFLVVPSLEHELANKRRVYGTVITDNFELRQRLERVSVALVESDAKSPNSIVPGFRVYSVGTPCFDRQWELARAFGITNVQLFGGGWSRSSDNASLRNQKRLPKCTEIRLILK
ncbi:hypothetical protein BDZ45DRAFT_15671 [Acephala macrosclerotiorum]|nr:hypothetical protein BDZ45DRAFT_15671 [Acephala macrosclerotiorum]